MAMTTVRIRQMRKQTQNDLIGDLEPAPLVSPVEVMVYGALRAVVHFPAGKPVVAWRQKGWEPHEKALAEAAKSARTLAESSSAQWRMLENAPVPA